MRVVVVSILECGKTKMERLLIVREKNLIGKVMGIESKSPAFKIISQLSTHLAYDFEHAIRPVDCSSENFFNWLQRDQEKLISLGKELYKICIIEHLVTRKGDRT